MREKQTFTLIFLIMAFCEILFELEKEEEKLQGNSR